MLPKLFPCDSARLKVLRFLNSVYIYVLNCILFGSFWIEFVAKDIPCLLCLLQRFAMIGMAICIMCNLKFGVKALHYALSLFFALFGAIVSLWQISLHICRPSSPYGHPIFGHALYEWSLIIFASSLFATALLLCFHEEENGGARSLSPVALAGSIFLFLIAFVNVVVLFLRCGFTIL